MSEKPETGDSDLSIEELSVLLAHHTETAAERARAKLGGTLSETNLAQFLTDPDCLRCETVLCFDADGLESHQFAEPFFDDEENKRGCRLHIHPRFREVPEAIPYFVAYMAALINYGPIVNADVCERYGAALLGMSKDGYYQKLCQYVDSRPAEDG